MNHQPDTNAAGVAPLTPEEQHMYQTLEGNVPVTGGSTFLPVIVREACPDACIVLDHCWLPSAWEDYLALAMEVEEAKIALSDKGRADIPLEWVMPGLNAAISRPDLVSHTGQLAERIAARIKNCLTQAQLTAGDIDAVFLTGGSVRLAHVRNAIKKAVPSARLVEGDTFGAVGKGLTLEALRRYGPRA